MTSASTAAAAAAEGIHPNSGMVYSQQTDKGDQLLIYYNSLTLPGQREVYVGDVVCVDCPEDDNSISHTPCASARFSSKQQGDNAFYPLERPWKVGLILALWSTLRTPGSATTTTSATTNSSSSGNGPQQQQTPPQQEEEEEDQFDMSIQWLHRDIHLDEGLLYKEKFNTKVRLNKRPSVLIESSNVQDALPVSRILPPLVRIVGGATGDIVNTQKELTFSCKHRFTDTVLSDTEKTIGWDTVNATSQPETVSDVLTRGWKIPDFINNRRFSLQQQDDFVQTSIRVYEKDAPFKLVYRKKLQDEQQLQQQIKEQAAAEATVKIKPAAKKAASKKKETAKPTKTTKKSAGKKVTAVKRQTSAKVDPPTKRKATTKAATTKTKAIAKVVTSTKGCKATKAKTKTAAAAKKKRSAASRPPPSSSSRAAATKKSRHHQDQVSILSSKEDDGELAMPVGKPVTKPQNGITYYTSVQVPWDVQRWDSSLRRGNAKKRGDSSSSSNYWTFHVGDIVAVATLDCEEPTQSHAQEKSAGKSKSKTNPWYPYNTKWCPAVVLAIFEDENVYSNSDDDTAKDMNDDTDASCDWSKYKMVIQWFIRWNDLHHSVRRRLLQAKDDTIATQLQTYPYMVLESYSYNDCPVTSALGKLDMVCPATNSHDAHYIHKPNMPPSLALQCQYKHRQASGKEKYDEKFFGDGSISNFLTDAKDWENYYQPWHQGGFKPWTRMIKKHGFPSAAYRKFLGKGKAVGRAKLAPASKAAATSTRPKRSSTANRPGLQPAKANNQKVNECIAKFKEEEHAATPSIAHEAESPTAASQVTASTAAEDDIAAEKRILAPYKPIHKDKSSSRVYYDRIRVAQPFETYAIRSKRYSSNDDDEDDSNDDQDSLTRPHAWELKVGDMVVARYDHYKASGAAFFEPDMLEHPIDTRENAKHYPFVTKWGVAEVVCIWKLDAKDSPRHRKKRVVVINHMMVEIRWFYRKKEVPGFEREGKSLDGALEVHEELFESDHMENIEAVSILAPVTLHATSSRSTTCQFTHGMPVLDFFCRRFFSIRRKSLVPCGGLELRRTRGKSHSMYIREDAILRELMCPNSDQRTTIAPVSHAESGSWKEAFQHVIQKLSLTDASKESSESLMIGREKEQNAIRSFLKDAICGGSEETGSSMFVAGPPGVGKTGCIRAAIAKLQRDQAKGKVPAFRFVALNGMEMRHPFEAYVRLLEALKGGMKVKKSEEEAAAALEKYFTTPGKLAEGEKDVVTVVLLDEIDYLVTQKQTVMYNFFDWPLRSAALCAAGRQSKRLVVIGVSNTMNLPERLQPRVQSRIGNRRCYFKSYNVKEIQSILQAKITQASPNFPVFDPDAILFAARKTAAVSGDVRKAFHICRSAAERVMTMHATVENNSSNSNNQTVLVRIPDVQKVSREASDSAISKAVAQSTPFEALLIVSLASLSRSTGRENKGFDVEELLTKMEAVAGAFGDEQYTPPPRFEETLFLLNRLAEAQVVLLQTPTNASLSFRTTLTGMGGAWPIASMLLDATHLLLALRGTKHSGLAQKYLSKNGF